MTRQKAQGSRQQGEGILRLASVMRIMVMGG
jgi:hypothetical protein